MMTNKDYTTKHFFVPTKNIDDIRGNFYDYETVEADYPKLPMFIPTVPSPSNYGSMDISVVDSYTADRTKPDSCNSIDFNRAYNEGPYPTT
jgi:hypothetical protein